MKGGAWFGLLGLLATSCGGSPVLRAAESGDRASLGTAVAERQKKGDLSTSEAARLARVVADRELRAAKGTDALARVRDVRSCARELDDALAFRMETPDEAGAEAALARIDGGGLSLDDARAHAADADGAWRAVGARALVRGDDRPARLRALVDPDPRVRRQAVRAARDDQDPNDLDELEEVVRVDPEPIVKTEAVRAMVALEPLPAGELADALRDLWPKADEGLREDLAIAWASPRVWDVGGSEALRVLVSSGSGAGVVEGAAAILRNENTGGEVVTAAIGALERAILSGSRERRLQAIAEAPIERPELRDALQKASEDGDFQIRVAALSRLAEAKRPGAIEALVDLARTGSPVAGKARFSLAVLGDRRTQAWVEQDLAAPDAEDRLGAATTLAIMGVPARAAPLLADADSGVRARAACTLLVAARRP